MCEAFATIFALVGNEIALLTLPPSSDDTLGWLTFGVFLFFLIDQLVQINLSGTRYVFSLRFALDTTATVLLLPYVHFVKSFLLDHFGEGIVSSLSQGTAARASRAARIGSRAGRTIKGVAALTRAVVGFMSANESRFGVLARVLGLGDSAKASAQAEIKKRRQQAAMERRTDGSHESSFTSRRDEASTEAQPPSPGGYRGSLSSGGVAGEEDTLGALTSANLASAGLTTAILTTSCDLMQPTRLGDVPAGGRPGANSNVSVASTSKQYAEPARKSAGRLPMKRTSVKFADGFNTGKRCTAADAAAARGAEDSLAASITSGESQLAIFSGSESSHSSQSGAAPPHIATRGSLERIRRSTSTLRKLGSRSSLSITKRCSGTGSDGQPSPRRRSAVTVRPMHKDSSQSEQQSRASLRADRGRHGAKSAEKAEWGATESDRPVRQTQLSGALRRSKDAISKTVAERLERKKATANKNVSSGMQASTASIVGVNAGGLWEIGCGLHARGYWNSLDASQRASRGDRSVTRV